MSEHGAAVNSFSLDGKLQMGFFASGNDQFHVRIDGDRIETLIARMLGFPSELEFEQALAGEISSDPSVPDVVRTIPRISMSFFIDTTSEI